MENVPGLLSMRTKKDEPVKNIILQEQRKIGYNVTIIKLNSADYRIPQQRHRIFFTGIRKDHPFHPEKLTPPPKILNKKDYITVSDAISDLPIIHAKEGKEIQEYNKPPQNKYQEYCRKNSNKVYNHISMRHTNRIIERFKQIQQGESVTNVDKKYGQRKRGDPTKISGKAYNQNNYRVYSDKPSPTITASFQSNFIHPYLNRNFTAREAARLQSYPDNYIFKGNRTNMSWDKNLSQYQQIGNSVPPLLSKAIAENITEYFSQKNIIKE